MSADIITLYGLRGANLDAFLCIQGMIGRNMARDAEDALAQMRSHLAAAAQEPTYQRGEARVAMAANKTERGNQTSGAGMSAHTPGPWRIERGAGHAAPCIRGADSVHTNGKQRNSLGISSASYSDMVCEFMADIDLPVPHANARLIAAAPELLDTLRNLLNDPALDCSYERRNAARAAIAHAEGK